MQKQNILLAVILILFSGCGNPANNTETEDSEPMTEDAYDDSHNSRNSLDWAGVYRGVLPCNDCPGIDTRITLNENGTFERTQQHLEKEQIPQQDEGTFSWDDSGSFISLTIGDSVMQTYQVGENRLFILDESGQRTSSLDKNIHDPRVETKRWVLTEIRGRSIAPEELPAEAYLEFSAEDWGFSGNSSCNTFRGNYDLMDGNRIHFGNAASTMRACLDMETEAAFLDMLRQVDNYNVTDSTLILNKARRAPMARFRSAD